MCVPLVFTGWILFAIQMAVCTSPLQRGHLWAPRIMWCHIWPISHHLKPCFLNLCLGHDTTWIFSCLSVYHQRASLLCKLQKNKTFSLLLTAVPLPPGIVPELRYYSMNIYCMNSAVWFSLISPALHWKCATLINIHLLSRVKSFMKTRMAPASRIITYPSLGKVYKKMLVEQMREWMSD